MSRQNRSLPVEYRGPLDFPAVIATLDSLVGEAICVRVGSAQDGRSGLEVMGPLRRLRSRTSGGVFAIGDAGYLSLEPEDFSSADVSTLEGNFYFTLTIELSGATLLIGDVELVGLGLFRPRLAHLRRPRVVTRPSRLERHSLTRYAASSWSRTS
jgi:hypothetical protein